MYDKSFHEVTEEDIVQWTNKRLYDEILWWDKNLRYIQEDQLEDCEPPPNAPSHLNVMPVRYQCTPRIYWVCINEAKARGIY